MSAGSEQDVLVFTEALQLPIGEREAFVKRACVGAEPLRQRVMALLDVHARVGSFLDKPATEVAALEQKATLGEGPGDTIGRYKLLEQIGEGGWGVVFMAEQDEPVRRRVALKIVKPGMDTRSVIARFEAERQALAMMDHPGIAKVFDAGATESGRPFFVMELIRGIKITDYCDQHSLTTEERLKLFIQVCQAVQHAHQKGVIHRDIKPSNILVTSTAEGAALPVVIDFGIAKATTSQRLTDKTVFTSFQMLIGTPAYMSPEQAALTSVDVDTRTDIYSLGILLYELLTGSTPFETEALLRAGLDEIRRVIREDDPIRPSTRLSKMTDANLTAVARNRRSEPPGLIRAISGDLDCIAMKALQRDPCRRYETANGMAVDVGRFLANEPIAARPPSKLYRFQKILARNKLLFASLGAIAVLLVASLIVVGASLARERQARRDADSDKRKAQQVTQFLEDMLQSVGPSVALGRDTTMVQEVLDRTAERVGKEMSSQPAVEAQLRSLIGTLYFRIGKYDRSEVMHRAALAICRGLFGQESREVGSALNDLGLALLTQGKLSEGETVNKEALGIRKRVLGNEHHEVATSLNNLANVYRHQRRMLEAKALVHEALAIRRKLFGDENLDVADSLRTLSIILGDERKWADAEATAREVLRIRRQLLGIEHPWIASALVDVAWAAGGAGKKEEAEALEREALVMRQKLLNPEHPDIAKSLYLVGDRMRQRGKLGESHSILSAALSIQRKLLGPENPALLDSLTSLGLVLKAEGKWGESEAVHREALASLRKLGENESSRALPLVGSLTRVLVAQKKFIAAEQLLDEALTPKLLKQTSSADFLNIRAELRARREQWQEAAVDAVRAFEHQPSDYKRYSVLAALLIKTRNWPAYEESCIKILAISGNATNPFVADQVAKACLLYPSAKVDLAMVASLANTAVIGGAGDNLAIPFFQFCKALSEYREGHFGGAANWAEHALKHPRVDSHAQACAVLAMAEWKLGNPEKARAMLEKGNALTPRDLPKSAAEGDEGDWLIWLVTRICLDEASALIAPETTK